MCHSGRQKSGLTLIEMTLVVATIALLVGFALPAVRALMNSFESEGGVKSMINAAMSSARAMAAKNQQYVGVRFQHACTSADPAVPLEGLAEASQYIIFIVHDPAATGLAAGFRAVEGLDPVKLPDRIGVMDVRGIGAGTDLGAPTEFNDATAFSVVFSPSGKLVVHDVQVRNRDGVYQPDNTAGGADKSSDDQVFNSPANICALDVGRFIQDDYLTWGLEKESSCTSFVIYERGAWREAFQQSDVTVRSEYLDSLIQRKTVYVSPYGGRLISSE